MSSKEKILEKISKNKPPAVDKPVLDFGEPETGQDLTDKFVEAIAKSGATVKSYTLEELNQQISKYTQETNSCVHLPYLKIYSSSLSPYSSREQLDEISTSVLEVKLGVAENGAMWISEENLPHRAVPFIAQGLVLVLHKSTIVPTMHQAYRKINLTEDGYGVFIAGPSKTADIEQSLVIGAHGAKSLLVILVD